MDLSTLTAPVVAAPMAGGPSTPELVAAVSEAGGYGYLAAGYKTVDVLREQIAATRALTERPFGVNLFVPTSLDRAALEPMLACYVARLRKVGAPLGVTELPEPSWDDTDHYAEKVDLLVEESVDSVSFTFGVPSSADVERLHAAGSQVVVTVTTAGEARVAESSGADVLVVQGNEAGGHRGSHRPRELGQHAPLLTLLDQVRAVTELPLVAAGGIATSADVSAVLRRGAVAAQVGTALLLTDEAGTSAVHRKALCDSAFDETYVTRSFSGRAARALHNTWIDELDADAPPVYPVVDQLTKPIRAAAVAAGDAQHTHLWAGQRWRATKHGPAAGVVRALTPKQARSGKGRTS